MHALAFNFPLRVSLGRCRLPLALLAALAAPLAGCATGAASAAAGGTAGGYVLSPADRAVIAALPAPRPAGIDLSGACRNTEPVFEDARAKAQWTAPSYGLPLRLWAISHVGVRAGTSEPPCADIELATRLWQSAIGSPITGRWSERDVTEFVRIVDAHDSRYATAARMRKENPPDEVALQKRRIEQSIQEQQRNQEQASLQQLCEREGARVEHELQTLPQRSRQAVIEASNVSVFAMWDVSKNEVLARGELEKQQRMLQSKCGRFYPNHIRGQYEQRELDRKRMEYKEYFNKVK